MDVYEIVRIGFAVLLFIVLASVIGVLLHRILKKNAPPLVVRFVTVAYILMLLFIVFRYCFGESEKDSKIERAILLADREAPLGWVYLRVFSDSSFEFESRGLERHGEVFSGKARIKADSIFFYYKDSIPDAGTIAVYSDKYVAYVNGNYPERVEIRLNKLDVSNKN